MHEKSQGKSVFSIRRFSSVEIMYLGGDLELSEFWFYIMRTP